MPVTVPVEETLATDPVVEKVPPPVPSVRCMVVPEHKDVGPEMAAGSGSTVTATELEHPWEVVTVILAVPEVIPVTTPLLLTVATRVSELDQVDAPVADNVVVPPIHTLGVPVITGVGSIVIDFITAHPVTALVYIIVSTPGDTVVRSPNASVYAMEPLV